MVVLLEILLGVELLAVFFYIRDKWKQKKHLERQLTETAKMLPKIMLHTQSTYSIDEIINVARTIDFKEDIL